MIEPGDAMHISLHNEIFMLREKPVVRVDYDHNKSDQNYKWLIPMMTVAKFWLHEYEILERIVIKQLFGPEDYVLEAGTGIGITGVEILKQGARLLTLDPNLDNIYLSMEVFALNGYKDVTLKSAAVANGTGSVVLTTDKMDWDATILDSNIITEHSKQTVPCVDINELFEEYPEVNAVHLDVEGAEPLIIDHMNFDQINKISMEVHPSMIGFDTYDDIIVPKLVEAGFQLKAQAGMERNHPTHNYAVGWERVRDEE
jgi:FkbM family methyltransferase